MMRRMFRFVGWTVCLGWAGAWASVAAGQDAAGEAKPALPSVAPAWGELVVKDTGRAYYLADKANKTVGRVTVEPKGDAIAAVKLTPGADSLLIDTSGASAVGVEKATLNLNTIADKEFAEGRYVMSVTLQGPKDAECYLFFEGTTAAPEKKHYYKFRKVTLTGEKETVEFAQIPPEKLDELHLRFDMVTPGEYRLYDAAFGQPPKKAPKKAEGDA